MSLRKGMRLAMVVLAVAVTALIAAQWRGAADLGRGPDAPDAPRGLTTRTDWLDHKELVNGVLRFQVRADSFEGFEDGRSEYTGSVGVDLYPVPEEEGRLPEPTRVSGERLSIVQATEGGRIDEVRIHGGVVARLPSGVEVESPELTYAAEAGFVRTEAGVLLRHAGLLIDARSMLYHVDRHSLEIWSSAGVGLRTDPEAEPGSAPTGLEGRADALAWDPDATGVTLRGVPDIELPEAAIAGTELHLDLDDDAGRLRGITATGDARVVWTAGPDRAVEAEELVLELGDDGAPRVIRSRTIDGKRPRLDGGTAGDVEADRIDLHVRSGGSGSAVASGSVSWVPGKVAELRRLRAGRLQLGLGAAGPETARADGDVELEIARRDQLGSLTGDSAELGWDGDDLATVSFLQGVAYRLGETSLTAARGAWDHAGAAWVMDGLPRPRYEAPDFGVEADRVALTSDGGVEATGNVSLELRGAQVATLGPMLGGAEAVSGAAASARVAPDGGLRLAGGVRLWHADRVLEGTEMTLVGQPPRLQASDDVLVVLGAATTGGEPITLTGGLLLAEGQPPELRLAQQATLRDGDRRISGDNVVVAFDEDSGWQAIELIGDVVMDDPAGSARGARLLYDAHSGEITVSGTSSAPASFTDQRGMEIRDPRGLRLLWGEETVEITALQQGTTRTVRRGGR